MRQDTRREHFGSGARHQVAEASGNFTSENLRARSALRCPQPARRRKVVSSRVAEIDRTGLRAQQRDHLTQRQVQNFVQVEGLRGDDRHRIQRIQFAIAAANLVFGALLLGHVEQEALVALDFAGGVAGRETALHRGEQCAVLAAQT